MISNSLFYLTKYHMSSMIDLHVPKRYHVFLLIPEGIWSYQLISENMQQPFYCPLHWSFGVE